MHASTSNFAIAPEYFMYFKLDNVIYQVDKATVNSATVDAGIEDIATTTWSGFGTTMKELVGAPRDIAIATFGGIKNAGGASIVANSSAATLTQASSYHPYNTMNVAGTVSTNAFIKNRLSSIEFHHKASAGASDEKFVFPVTSMNIEYTNNITYLTP